MATVNMIEKEKEILSSALQELLPSMDADNRDKIALKLKISERTVYRYLTGEVVKVATAKEIISECRKNIIQREQELSKHISL